ncbi:hypothetical protein [Sphingomonas oligophenolica]|nr:hypothetical protein [Sphingomonas oligophenolica]
MAIASHPDQVIAIRRMRKVRLITIGLLLLLVIVALVMPSTMSRIRAPQPTPTLFYMQDLALLPLFCLAVVTFGRGRPSRLRLPATIRRPGWWLAGAACCLFVICSWGYDGVFQGIDLSRDEQLAVFDSAIFGSGHLAAPIPSSWQTIAPALNLLFILPIGDHAEWISAYLPVNAALRALVSTVADPVFTSPILVVIGLLALASIGRRLWKDSPGSQMAALLCYLCSSQIIITAMTAYAMTAHLALNLVWLMLFLRNDRLGLAGTLVVGFLATGVHQPLFHPLFALPFVLGLARQGNWRRVCVYGVGYALICGFWMAWPVWMSAHAGPVPAGNDREGIDYATRLAHILALVGVDALWTMAVNLIRFATWQHLLLLPMVLLGAVGGWKDQSLVRSLTIGLVLPILVMGFLLPWQGHGWGYRYLHPVLGNACLLAGYGWRQAETAGVDLRRSMLWTTVGSLLLLPVHGWMAHQLVAAQAEPDYAIRRIAADIAVIDAGPGNADLVINAPDLGNRPIRLLGPALRPADIASLCRGRTTAFVDAPRIDGLAVYYSGRGAVRASDHQRALRAAALAVGCHIVPEQRWSND